MAREINRIVSVPKGIRRELERRVSDFASLKVTPDWGRLLAPPMTEDVFIEKLGIVRKGADSQPPISMPPTPRQPELTAVDLLAEAAKRQSQEAAASSPSSADLTDQSVRLKRVQLCGFRGSPDEIEISFTDRGSPVSSIIFGENGVGKSTIVDAIEFATQGRVGRSSNFASPLAPTLGSFARETTPWAKVALSDGTTLERRLERALTGEPAAAPTDVRPGFRLAPMTIKRPDILRFLDSESLERGAVLLDYFPAEAGGLGARPEEQAHRLKAEMAELRIKRSGLSSRLAPLLGVIKEQLESKDTFRSTIREVVMGGLSRSMFEEKNGWQEVPDEEQSLINQLAQTHDRLAVCKSRYVKMNEILNPVVHQDQVNTLQAIIDEVGTELSSAFLRINSEHHVASISVIFGESGPLSLDLLVHLDDGRKCFPHQLFSEAYRDLIALLFFTSVAKKASERGQAQILIMDDVLQSIDATIRHSFIDYVLDEFADWQLVFTVHDRYWRDRLRDLFAAHGHTFVERNIRGWSFANGPNLAAPDADSITNDLRQAIGGAEPGTVGLLTGKLLEEICNQLTWRIQLPVIRNRDDRYTLGDLWPPVYLRLQDSPADSAIRRVGAQRGLRNLTAHASPISLNLSSAEASSFANAVLELYGHVRCAQCRSWIKGSNHPSCTCGALAF
jgi:hypothetical protein